MKRHPSKIDPVFNDPGFANQYVKKHIRMARGFGKEYAEKLNVSGFQAGRILDSGCGFGGTLIYLAERFPEAELFGVDLSEPLLEIARNDASSRNVADRLKFEKADVHNLPYVDDYFDVVLNINMLHLVTDPEKMLNELERVLRKHGDLIIADIRRSWIGLFEREFKSALSSKEARRLISESCIRDGIIISSMLWWRFESRSFS